MSIPYAWTCHACGGANPAGSDRCGTCDCAATVSRDSLEKDIGRLQAHHPGVRLEPQLPGWAVLNLLGSWLLTATGVLVWFVASDTTIAYGGVGLLIVAWAWRKLVRRSLATVPENHDV